MKWLIAALCCLSFEAQAEGLYVEAGVKYSLDHSAPTRDVTVVDYYHTGSKDTYSMRIVEIQYTYDRAQVRNPYGSFEVGYEWTRGHWSATLLLLEHNSGLFIYDRGDNYSGASLKYCFGKRGC